MRRNSLMPRCVLITGASSGIGAALALEYAAGGVRLVLLGRNADRLAETGRQCEARAAEVSCHEVDVRDQVRMAEVIEAEHAKAPLDLVIANAGIARSREDPVFSRELVATNVVGILNTVEPVLPLMTERQSGQILIVSSLAAFRAIGGPPGYAASKAWARLYGEALRGRLASKGIAVCVACPGFVRTPMTDGIDMPGVSAAETARLIRAGLARNQPRISFPRGMTFRVWFSNALPTWWTDRKIRKKLQAARSR